MASILTMARQCQLFRHDVEELLTLPIRVAFGPSSSSTAEEKLTLSGTFEAILCAATTRALTTNTFVRVQCSTSKTRQEMLLQQNPFVQAWERGVVGGDGTQNNNNNNNKRLPMTHRVGRLTALLPKPKRGGGATSSSSSSAEESVDDWLLAVHFGERTELIPVKHVSDDAFLDEEHQVYVSSVVSGGVMEQVGATTNNSGSSSSPQGLLTAAECTAVLQQLRDLRKLIAVAARGANTSEGEAAAAVEDLQKQRLHGSSSSSPSMKRGRTEENVDVVVAGSSPSDALEACFGLGAQSQAAKHARLEQRLHTCQDQLAGLRHLLQSKDEDLTAALQQQQLAGQEHAETVGVWQTKLREESAARERAAKDATTQLKAKEAALSEANEKLRRLVEMTRAYKAVADLVVKHVLTESERQSVKAPTDICRLLEQRR